AAGSDADIVLFDPDIKQKRVRLEGEIPSVINPPKGCRFSTRCPRHLGAICDIEPPPDVEAVQGHRIKCHIPLEELRKVEPIFQTAAE
ncbi:MAG: oligopeptide/dipeptide ABC transporter ATP-binding protein, partial [Alphaproteobacteria bacterium]